MQNCIPMNMKKYQTDESRRALARRIAAEAMVLLKNEGELLPLSRGTKVAVFGRTQNEVIIGGSGSGTSQSSETLPFMQELKRVEIIPESGLEAYYLAEKAKEVKPAGMFDDGFDPKKLEGLVASGLFYEIFGRYEGAKEECIPERDLIEAARAETDTAIYILGRMTGGEECDRHVQDDYYLTDSEKQLISMVAGQFEKVIVVFNINGLVDMAWLQAYPSIQAAVFMGTAGEQAAGALADLLVGDAVPSGKLAQTVACSYEDYPTANTISVDKTDLAGIKTYDDYGLSAEKNGSVGHDLSPVTVYEEDIYVGYRYFDSFRKPVLYPFGFGLSYASFAWECKSAVRENDEIRLLAAVTNTSAVYAGKEVLQLYVSAPSSEGMPAKAEQELKAFVKTKTLAPGETELVTLTAKVQDFASFHEDEKYYMLEAGVYELRVGNSSRNTRCVCTLVVEGDIITRRVQAEIGLSPENRGKVKRLRPDGCRTVREADAPFALQVSANDLLLTWPQAPEHDFSVAAEAAVAADVLSGRVSPEAMINSMSLDELAVLCNGYGSGLPFSMGGGRVPFSLQYADGSDIGYNSHPRAIPGYSSPAIKKYGIKTTYYQDGPASVSGGIAWPTGMMLSCSFNMELLYEFGCAAGSEADEKQVDSWLAPGMNIIRNPIEGRAFEYFSEDPYVCGACGVAIVRGAMENNAVTTCPKHFALNEQETFRRGNLKKNIYAVDTIVSAQAAREIYLRPFEMVVTQAKPRTIMTAFNRINGVFAAGHKELLTGILRGEWGFDGAVVTDWGDMDFVVDGADAVAAGNDVIMPGGPPVIAQVLKGYEEGRVTLDEIKTAVAHMLNYVLSTAAQKQGLS